MDDWTPFIEAEQNLDQYLYFFWRDDILDDKYPQIMEDFLHEKCPNNFCYVWVLAGPMKYSITDMCIGVPEEVAMYIKIKTGANQLDMNDYKITKGCSNKFQLEKKL